MHILRFYLVRQIYIYIYKKYTKKTIGTYANESKLTNFRGDNPLCLISHNLPIVNIHTYVTCTHRYIFTSKIYIQNSSWLWFYAGEICGILTWIILLHWTCWILYCIFDTRSSEIQMQRSPYFFETGLFLQKSYG